MRCSPREQELVCECALSILIKWFTAEGHGGHLKTWKDKIEISVQGSWKWRRAGPRRHLSCLNWPWVHPASALSPWSVCFLPSSWFALMKIRDWDNQGGVNSCLYGCLQWLKEAFQFLLTLQRMALGLKKIFTIFRTWLPFLSCYFYFGKLLMTTRSFCCVVFKLCLICSVLYLRHSWSGYGLLLRILILPVIGLWVSFVCWLLL